MLIALRLRSIAERVTPLARIIAWWLALCWVVVFWRLGYLSLLDPDEAHYAELTREMMSAHSWLVPLMDGSPFIDKPVLFHWLQAASISVLGDSEFAMRVPSAIAAAALILITWWIAVRLFDRTIGEWAAMMFVTLPLTFALSSVGVFDMVFACVLFAAVACLLIAMLRGPSGAQFAGYGLIAVAVMIKGPVAILLVALWLAAGRAIVPGAAAALRRLRWVSGLAMIGLISAPWFIWMSVQFRDRFVQDYLLAGNLWYFTAPLQFSTRVSDHLFYARTFFGAFFPWSLIALAGAIDDVRTRGKRERMSLEANWLWLWLGVVVLFFTSAGFKLDTYIFPVAPACGILASVAWHRARNDDSRRVTRFVVTALALILGVGGAVAAFELLNIDLGVGSSVLVLPAVLMVGGLWLLKQLHRRRWAVPQTPVVLIGTLLAAFAVVVQLGFPLLESSRPTRPMGQWVAAHTAEGGVVGSYGIEDWHASVRYYTNREVRRLHTFGEVRAFFTQFPEAQVLMLRRDYQAMRQAGLELEAVASRRAIVGRTGKVFRTQVWGQLMVVTRPVYAQSLAQSEWDLIEP